MRRQTKAPVSAEPEHRTIKITDLSRDPAFQVRSKMSDGTVKRYMAIFKSGKEMPAVQVAVVNGVPVLVDGWHRVAALERLGHLTVEAVVTQSSRQDARWMAAKANTEHGLPLKPAEHREVFRAYVQAKQHVRPQGRLKTYREMGTDLGRPHTTIRNWTKRHFPALYRRIGGNADESHGGIPERHAVPDWFPAVAEGLQKIEGAFRSLSDPTARGELVAAVDAAVAELKGSAAWTIEEQDF